MLHMYHVNFSQSGELSLTANSSSGARIHIACNAFVFVAVFPNLTRNDCSNFLYFCGVEMINRIAPEVAIERNGCLLLCWETIPGCSLRFEVVLSNLTRSGGSDLISISCVEMVGFSGIPVTVQRHRAGCSVCSYNCLNSLCCVAVISYLSRHRRSNFQNVCGVEVIGGFGIPVAIQWNECWTARSRCLYEAKKNEQRYRCHFIHCLPLFV